MFENEFTKHRKNKAEILKSLGGEPFGSIGDLEATMSAKDFLRVNKNVSKNNEELTKDIFTIFGRAMLIKNMGKAGFVKIQDQGTLLQIFVSKNGLGDKYDIFKKSLDLGDIIAVTGYAFYTKTEELSIHATDFKILTKALKELPEKFHGLTDKETRYRKRYLDMIMNPEVTEVFKTRSKIIQTIRDILNKEDFIEVETPILNSIPGGANAKPFVTHYNALGQERFLRIAPELYLKRLLVGGMNSVFEIGKNFRNEGMDATHNPEFTSVEFYQAFSNYRHLMTIIQDMFLKINQLTFYSRPENEGKNHLTSKVEFGDYQINFNSWNEITFKDSLIKYGIPAKILNSENLIYIFFKGAEISIKPNLPLGKLWEELFDNFVEPNLVDPTFITEYPTSISPLARRLDSNPEVTERFELFIAGREIANGFNELNDPEDQYERFMSQVSQKDNDDESMFMDKDFVEALMNGLPPTAGAGLGIDRIVMLFTNQISIKDVMFFPAMK